MQKYLASGMVGLLVLSLGGCALQPHVPKEVVKNWEASGGSRADASVELSYTYNPVLETPVEDEAQGKRIAEARCRLWGYASAEPFDMKQARCQQFIYRMGGALCTEKVVTQVYQCLGQGKEEEFKKTDKKK